MNNRPIITTVMLLSLLFAGACAGGRHPDSGSARTELKNIDISSWQMLAGKRVYFGHKSVGATLVDGVKDVLRDHTEIQVRVLDLESQADDGNPAFLHSLVGKNGDIGSKIEAFSKTLAAMTANPADIALLKFCWYDFVPDTDVNVAFAQYKQGLELLKQRHPGTRFIHVTTPLTSNDEGLKAWFKSAKDLIKYLIGKTNYFDNRARCLYNELLRQEYAGKEPVFDLAQFESTLPDGSRTFSTMGGRVCYSLAPAYTDDAGHLNRYGRQIIGEQFLIFLASIAADDFDRP
jgi:hypothetical protein